MRISGVARHAMSRLIDRSLGRRAVEPEELPFRSELFSTDQLALHATSLAYDQQATRQGGPDQLLRRLEANEAILRDAYQMVVGAAAIDAPLSPADEWLLDNYYLIDEQIRTARRHLPRNYSRELPRLIDGHAPGQPRVYDVALQLISHVDGRITEDSLNLFLAAYQSVTPLTLGELWAVPIMLRLALLENLRRVALRMTESRLQRSQADSWAEQLLAVADQHPRRVVSLMAELSDAIPALDDHFVAELAHRLQSQGSAMALPLLWLEQHLAEQAASVELLMQRAAQEQAADQVSIGNSIGSLRLLGALDWRTFVETHSLVEHLLRGYPRSAFGEVDIAQHDARQAMALARGETDVYGEMDFATRDRYRHVVEWMAKRSTHAEWDVASLAVAAARSAGESRGSADRTAHVGYYLIGRGRAQLEVEVGVRRTLLERGEHLLSRAPLTIYLGSIALIALISWALVVVRLAAYQPPPALLTLAAVLALGGALQIGVALVNWLVTLFVPPQRIPRLDFSAGIPPDCRTLIAVPTLLTSARDISAQIEQLEIAYLANRDRNLHFALLTDWRDAAAESIAGDQELLEQARDEIAALGAKYADERGGIFFLFHRPRLWNQREGTWMGFERKRGKLAALNGYLRGGARDAFSLVVGDTQQLSDVQFVISLDADTQLPRDAAAQLVGAMAHPLNRPQIDPRRRVVCDGYTILQPRVELSLPAARRSWFVRLFGGNAGIDPYTGAVSDVYQDLFREGSFIGKGIYDVDAFTAVLEKRFADNLILSHDLVEGCHARSGLISDVELYEPYPSRYLVDVSRRHRWIRGDWQILFWALPWVPGATGAFVRNSLSLLSRWKIFDNLRRSLVAPALVGLLAMAWLAPWWPASLLTSFVLVVILLPVAVRTVVELLKRPADVSWPLHLRQQCVSAARYLAQALSTVAFLLDEAIYSVDATVRTLVRLLVTKRNLLQWRTSVDAEQSARTDLAGVTRAMWLSPLGSAALACLVGVVRPAALPLALPVLALWFLSPVLAWWLSRPLPGKVLQLSDADRLLVEAVAAKTWRFFETFVAELDNWLPPDNFQESPLGIVAHRTSPTNIGLALLSNLAAYDLGFLSASGLEQRTTDTFRTLERLERWQGHFINWYDTRTLEVLRPRYVSTVDSGNLVGHLLTLRIGLLETIDALVFPAAAISGLQITLRQLTAATQAAAERLNSGKPFSPERDPAWRPLIELQQFEGRLANAPATTTERRALLDELLSAAESCASSPVVELDDDAGWWSRALARRARAWRDELELQMPPAFRGSLPASFERRNTNGADTTEPGDGSEPAWIGAARALYEELDGPISLRRLAQLGFELAAQADPPGTADQQSAQWYQSLRQQIDERSRQAAARVEHIEQLAEKCLELADADFEPLYDKGRQLLAIGFNIDEHRRDGSFYDLLASEARLTSYVAIASGQLRQSHWFALGRPLTRFAGEPTLVSWSGSMFEYLMPLLVMPTFDGTLLEETYLGAVARQVAYGTLRRVPWGISESGYNVTDAHLNYQYRAFGVPGLGLKRGLTEDLVVAPYATMMALVVDPRQACANLRRMTAEGFEARYGYYEAIDYTPSRVARGQTFAIVKSFMAHHQGMSLLAMDYVLANRPMQRRFESYPPFQATQLLLHERVPQVTPVDRPTADGTLLTPHTTARETPMRVFPTPHTPQPEVHLLSNGRYHVMVDNAGSGYSRWNDLAVTRWQEDVARDDLGTYCYVRDCASGELWSTGYQPTRAEPSYYEAIFPHSRAEFRRRDFEIELHTEVTVSPEDDVELRRVSLTNQSRTARTLELTSYAEVVLAAPAADATHPAFNKLFVQTELATDERAILCVRRPRGKGEKTPTLVHLMAVHGRQLGEPSYETDRAAFIGRGRDLSAPRAFDRLGALSNTAGSVLDPVVAVRNRIKIEPDETVVVDIVTGIAETREAALGLAGKYHDRHLADRLLNLAWTHGQVILQQLGISEGEVQLYGRLAGSIVFSTPLRRASPSVIARNLRGQPGLWGHGISGDLPILLLRIGDATKIDLVRQLVQAHAYWRFKGLQVDLTIWNEDQSGYRQHLQDAILAQIANSSEAGLLDRPGGIFVRRPDQMSEEDRVLMQSLARVVLVDEVGTLAEQVERKARREPNAPKLTPLAGRGRSDQETADVPTAQRPELVFDNGHGGFTPDGRQYVITSSVGHRTPAPWANVLANPQFGCIVTESGGGYTWLDNAHELRVTPWYNDPVTDRGGEWLYLRDEESGQFWSPTPLPAAGRQPYVTRHGFGWSSFATTNDGIQSELTVFVSRDDAVKFHVLKIRNLGTTARRLSATYCVEWVLGQLRPGSLMHVVTAVDPNSGMLWARNPYNVEFPNYVAFLDSNEPQRTVTGDRVEFLGRNGSPDKPAAMSRTRLTGRVGAGLDPCGAMQVPVELAAGQEREIVFVLGAAPTHEEARTLAQRHRGTALARRALDAVSQYWRQTLEAVQIETPDPATNLLSNGWLLYQVLSCRLWGRSGFYQSGGAFGFRDQLQDVMALTHAEPRLTREQLLRAAQHQFVEGDVQHWWHPPTGRGVRTRISDDYLWLPLVTCRYVKQTGDTGVLNERAGFLEGRPVNPGEEGYYDLPIRSDQSASLYEHCLRAIRHGLRFGAHGLPLMGCGDWNDGMNLVGVHGQGESVWLAFFLVRVLEEFADIARQRGDTDTIELCRSQVAEIKANIEAHAWDGGWYRRAYFDDGQPLGSASNVECQIDALPQSWAVLSGAGDPARARQAMEAVDHRLVRRKDGLIQLFDPPFDKSDLDPGYIKGYVPGVRENGGQYTHAAVWTVMAFAALGDERRAWELLNLINPIRHGATPESIATYKVEPYVAAADVYAVAPHVGRGGWTWYTGSAGWMYQLLIESLVGLRRDVDRLRFEPCLPAEWPTVRITYRYFQTTYRITLSRAAGATAGQQVTLDGTLQQDGSIRLMNDLAEHTVQIELS
jgi:cellobiose phosphorylase